LWQIAHDFVHEVHACKVFEGFDLAHPFQIALALLSKRINILEPSAADPSLFQTECPFFAVSNEETHLVKTIEIVGYPFHGSSKPNRYRPGSYRFQATDFPEQLPVVQVRSLVCRTNSNKSLPNPHEAYKRSATSAAAQWTACRKMKSARQKCSCLE
jgi:hypothetical protein